MHASDLVSQEEEALISAQQARRRNAAKKQRQKQRKQVLAWPDDRTAAVDLACHRNF